MEKKELICIGCPMGCQLSVEMEGGEVAAVSGNTCPRGDAYARKEVTNPTRIVTSTVIVVNGSRNRLPVKTLKDIPKSKIFEVMKEINKVRVTAPARVGDIVASNAAGTGVDIVATRNVDAR